MPRLVERGGGAFVGVSARAALEPFAGGGRLRDAKAARAAPSSRRWTPSTATDGVRANAILPSVIDTPANREAMPGRRPLEVGERRRQIAKVVRFLISDGLGAHERRRRSRSTAGPDPRRSRPAPAAPSSLVTAAVLDGADRCADEGHEAARVATGHALGGVLRQPQMDAVVVVARAQRPLGQGLGHPLAHPVERLAGLGGGGVDALQREQLGGPHRVVRVVAVARQRRRRSSGSGSTAGATRSGPP